MAASAEQTAEDTLAFFYLWRERLIVEFYCRMSDLILDDYAAAVLV
jgi:hypothetical protein